MHKRINLNLAKPTMLQCQTLPEINSKDNIVQLDHNFDQTRKHIWRQSRLNDGTVMNAPGPPRYFS